jgi:hypothetical protein
MFLAPSCGSGMQSLREPIYVDLLRIFDCQKRQVIAFSARIDNRTSQLYVVPDKLYSRLGTRSPRSLDKVIFSNDRYRKFIG